MGSCFTILTRWPLPYLYYLRRNAQTESQVLHRAAEFRVIDKGPRFKGAAFAGMLGFGAMSFLNAAAYGEPGVFDDRIVFGQSAAFDGPAAALGLGMREGILAAFNEANAA